MAGNLSGPAAAVADISPIAFSRSPGLNSTLLMMLPVGSFSSGNMVQGFSSGFLGVLKTELYCADNMEAIFSGQTTMLFAASIKGPQSTAYNIPRNLFLFVKAIDLRRNVSHIDFEAFRSIDHDLRNIFLWILWNFINTLTDLLPGLGRPRVPVLWTVF